MMEETGVIVEIKSAGVATVMCQRGSMCAHCASADACRMGKDEESTFVDATNTIGAQVGQRVKVAVETRSFLKSSFLLYIVPLIALVIGAIVGETIGIIFDLKVDPNVLAALIGTGFMVASLLIIKVSARALPKELYMPRIVAIVEEDT